MRAAAALPPPAAAGAEAVPPEDEEVPDGAEALHVHVRPGPRLVAGGRDLVATDRGACGRAVALRGLTRSRDPRCALLLRLPLAVL